MQNSAFRTRITSRLGSQTSPIVFCIQNSDFSTRIASVYGSQPSSVVLCIQNSVFCVRNTSLSGSKLSFVAFACKRATLGPELQVSMGPRPHFCFLHSKERLYLQNYKPLWVPDLTYGFWHSKQRL